MSNYIISNDVNKTLESFGLTVEEFKAKLNRKVRCSGIREAFPDFTSQNCKGMLCEKCPLSNQQHERVFLEWLNESRPREPKKPHHIQQRIDDTLARQFSPRNKPSTEQQINNLMKIMDKYEKTITNLEKQNELIISILQQNNQVSEIK